MERIVGRVESFCPVCMTQHPVCIIEKDETNIYKGQRVEYPAVYELCPLTGMLSENEDMMTANRIAMQKAYDGNIKKALKIGVQEMMKEVQVMDGEKGFELTQEEQFWEQVGSAVKMVLSTANADGSRVSSRTICLVVIDHKFYFQTDLKSTKANQIAENQHVALCSDNIQIEGTCVLRGDIENNVQFLEIMKSKFPTYFDRFTLLEDEALYEITPTFVERWVIDEDGTPFITKMDLVNHDYMMEKYEG